MQRLLALDVSTTTTGYVVMNEKLEVLHYGQFCIKDRSLSDIQYTTVIAKEVFKLVHEYDITDMIMEDVFVGFNPTNFKTWCRVHGGVGMSWAVKHNEPHFMMAVEARKRIGLSGKATKLEIQLEVTQQYALIKNSVYIAYKTQFDDLMKKRKGKEYTKNQFDYRIKKLSKAFEEETGISEHMADANVLARAYFQKQSENK